MKPALPRGVGLAAPWPSPGLLFGFLRCRSRSSLGLSSSGPALSGRCPGASRSGPSGRESRPEPAAGRLSSGEKQRAAIGGVRIISTMSRSFDRWDPIGCVAPWGCWWALHRPMAPGPDDASLGSPVQPRARGPSSRCCSRRSLSTVRCPGLDAVSSWSNQSASSIRRA